LAVSLFVVLSVAGLTLVQRLVSAGLRQEHNDVAGFIYAVLGVAYAVLLAFVVIAVWEQYQAARDTADREASELAEIYWLANQLPESEGHQVQELAQSYARVVVEEEWPLMEDGQCSPQAWALMDEIRQRMGEFEASTSTEQVLQDQGLSRVHDLADARMLRLLETHEDIPTILWVVLLSGGVITMGFTYLFGLESTWAHSLMVGALAAVIALVLFTIYSLDNPFAGDVRLDPEALELMRRGFEENQE
jgi:hypothetical protein